jgi:hypothetical protein
MPAMDTPVTGIPRTLLRLEGLMVLAASTLAYHAIGGPWTLFVLLILVPDVGLLGYAAGPRVGAFAYNAVHTYTGPAALAALAYVGVLPAAWPYCLIWLAHIGMDRALGLGLKYTSAFRSTHLGTIGRVERAV